MAKNNLVLNVENAYNTGFNDGLRIGAQSSVDLFCKVLNEHGYGYDRIMELIDEFYATRSEFAPMLDVRKDDCDYYRERIDRALQQIMGKREGFLPFEERYPELADAKSGVSKKMLERLKSKR